MKALLLVLAITGAQPATAVNVQQLVDAVAPPAVDVSVPEAHDSGTGSPAGQHSPPDAHPNPAGHQPLTGAALAVADCESGARKSDGTAVRGSWTADAKNPTSSASGPFEFIDSTFEAVTGLPAPARSHPVAVQLQAFEDLWDGGAGASHWAPSRDCWAGAL